MTTQALTVPRLSDAPASQRGARPPVAIVGGGIAGLVAAGALRRAGVPVVLYEAGRQVAGLAASFRDDDGFTYDFGAHFITNRLAAAIGVGAECRTVRHYGEAVLVGRRAYGYPFGLALNPRFALSGLAARLGAARTRPAPRSAAEWFRAAYGEALAEAVAIPLAEAWSGAPASELAASVGDKITPGIAWTMWLKLAGRLTGRAVSIGYSQEMPEGPSIWHVYPKGGLSLLTQHLAAELGDVIQLESRVEEILVDAGRAVAVRVNGREHAASAVISTAPVNVLAKLVRGTDALQHLARFRYRPMTFVNMRFKGRGLLPDVVLWTPERRFPFFRLTETPLSMPWLAPPLKTLITADIGCEVGDATWRMADDELGELCLDHLQPIIPDARQRYLGCRVLRTPIAYPVFLAEYEEDRRQLARSTGIDGLYSIGRNGEFAHILMEDIYWRTLRKTRQVLTALDSSPPDGHENGHSRSRLSRP